MPETTESRRILTQLRFGRLKARWLPADSPDVRALQLAEQRGFAERKQDQWGWTMWGITQAGREWLHSGGNACHTDKS